MAVIDAHHHVWRRAETPQPWIDPERMTAIDADFTLADLPAGEHGIDATVVVQSADSLRESLDLLGLVGPVAGVVGWVDILGDVAGQVVDLRNVAGPLVGIRSMVQAQHDPAYLDRPDVRAGISAVGDAGLPFDLVVRHDQLAAAARLAESHPDVLFVLDHLGKPPLTGHALGPWRADLARLAACPNVVAKLSGLATEADWASWSVATLRPAVDHALDVLGPERLMFGSDWPVCLLAVTYGRWMEVVHELTDDLAPDERDQIWGGTAARTYQLEEQG
ncbi:amidohydrolase family protein [Cellulomonas sp. McL0617]|uniref:amidohydrolase family protein n=1 Tax=Cellulomonas sp. McL0617 TaxID=3415675 RepID=UPI003CF78B8D